MDELKELKAKAYDMLAQMQFAQRELEALNLKIAQIVKAQEVKPE